MAIIVMVKWYKLLYYKEILSIYWMTLIDDLYLQLLGKNLRIFLLVDLREFFFRFGVGGRKKAWARSFLLVDR